MWQPIETAPKDRKPVLVYLPDDEKITSAYFEYWENYPAASRWSLCAVGCRAEDGDCYPSHWMPLPEPPEAT